MSFYDVPSTCLLAETMYAKTSKQMVTITIGWVKFGSCQEVTTFRFMFSFHSRSSLVMSCSDYHILWVWVKFRSAGFRIKVWVRFRLSRNQAGQFQIRPGHHSSYMVSRIQWCGFSVVMGRVTSGYISTLTSFQVSDWIWSWVIQCRFQVNFSRPKVIRLICNICYLAIFHFELWLTKSKISLYSCFFLVLISRRLVCCFSHSNVVVQWISTITALKTTSITGGKVDYI